MRKDLEQYKIFIIYRAASKLHVVYLYRFFLMSLLKEMGYLGLIIPGTHFAYLPFDPLEFEATGKITMYLSSDSGGNK